MGVHAGIKGQYAPDFYNEGWNNCHIKVIFFVILRIKLT